MRSIDVSYRGFKITGNRKRGFLGTAQEKKFSSPKLHNLKNHIRKLYDEKGVERDTPRKLRRLEIATRPAGKAAA